MNVLISSAEIATLVELHHKCMSLQRLYDFAVFDSSTHAHFKKLTKQLADANDTFKNYADELSKHRC